METLCEIEVGEAAVRLLLGDITAVETDLLVISAAPHSYKPLRGSVIEALGSRGISVRTLHDDLDVDLRETFGCWISKPVRKLHPDASFERLICYESLWRGTPAESISELFKAIVPALGGGRSVLSMPLLNTGYQHADAREIAYLLVDSAVHWLKAGYPLTAIQIAVRNPEIAKVAADVFKTVKSELWLELAHAPHAPAVTHDVFVSYSRKDSTAADLVMARLEEQGLSVFVDRFAMSTGQAWQQAIFDALERCRWVVPLYSPDFLKSSMCLDEFNIGWARGRKEERTCLKPIFWRDAAIPTYMELVNYVDCREASSPLLVDAVDLLTKDFR